MRWPTWKDLVKAHLPENVIIDYKGQSQDYKYSTQSIIFVFLLGILVVFLVLAAQFESYLNPLVIMLTVPLAIAGGLLGLYLTGSTLNLYSQIGLVMLVGLAAKNGILIVEFANQLRERRKSFDYAILKASEVRLRPIVMTGITTATGAIPLILSTGAGAETRMVIGVVVLAGVLSATLFTLFVVPVAYRLLSRRTHPPGQVARKRTGQGPLTPGSGGVLPTENDPVARLTASQALQRFVDPLHWIGFNDRLDVMANCKIQHPGDVNRTAHRRGRNGPLRH
jgi:multidrug efflux pump